MTTNNSIASPDDFGDDEKGLHRYWASEIDAARKELSPWQKSGEKIVKTYLDARTLTDSDDRNFNLFAANTGILKASLYARIPKPEVARRYVDYDDDVARVAGVILERALSYELENDHTFDVNARNVIEDRLLSGLGVAWVRYDTERDEQEAFLTDDYNEQTEDSESEGGELDELGADPVEATEPVTVITDETTPIDYVHWNDFYYSPARTWSEVRWVARRVFLVKDELVDRFGEEKAELVTMSGEDNKAELRASSIAPKNQVMQQGEIYEIWDKTSKRVLWFSPGAGQILDWKEDPYELPGFFPCPRPLIANPTTSNLIPTPDYKLVQDQYAELNQLNNRISRIVEACKVAGVYDADAKGIAGLLSDGRENILIPIDRWAVFAEKGGMRGQIEFLPIREMSEVLVVLQKARDIVKAQIYELTGISDIIRGSTNPYETAAAQNIKSQYASLRLGALQNEVALFMSELVALKAHLIAKFYEPERILARCGMLNKVDQQFIPAAIALIKNEHLSHYRITISVDALIAPNMEAERRDRTEAMTAIAGFLKEAIPAGQALPPLAPMFMSMLKFQIAGYRASKDLEGILDAGLAQLQAEQAQAKDQPKQPTPQEIEQQAKAQQAQQEFQLALARLELDKQKAANDFAIQQQKLQLQAQAQEIEMARLQVNAELTKAANQAEAVLQNRALDIKEGATMAGHIKDVIQHDIDSQIELHRQMLDDDHTRLNSDVPTNILDGDI